MLLVLDYAIELGGGFFMFFVIFVGDSIFYQRVLFCAGTFLYGIPIPIAYLLNESRVRNVIVNDGWAKGIKSIFHSNAQIRETQRAQSAKLRQKTETKKNDQGERDGVILNVEQNGVILNAPKSPNSQLRENENIIPEILLEYNRVKTESIEI